MLDEWGYVVLEDFVDAASVESLRRRLEELWEQEGAAAGSEFRLEPEARRLANLVNKGEIFERIVAMPRVLQLVEHVLGPEYKLGSLNARSANPYSQSGQPLHCDMGRTPDAKGYSVCNVIWMVDDFTPDNGATRVIPGSHRWGKLPQEALPDPGGPHPEEVLVTGRAGTVVVMNSHCWHGGTANRTGFPRRAVHAFYVRRDLPQQQWQKELLNAEVQARQGPLMRWLLALDDAFNDELCRQGTRQSGFLK
jgi:ectoine hydroxylase-related dioxygenase (phytanoyl-CoA dioxygenase family)